MLVLVMGVSGSGKSAVGRPLAEKLGFAFLDADDFHPQANVDKMAAGIALSDDDRLSWLQSLKAEVDRKLASGIDVVLSCSALKQRYRAILFDGQIPHTIIYLKGEPAVLHQRLEARKGHFMKASMLESQLATLEEPEGSRIHAIDISLPLDIVVEKALDAVRSGLQKPEVTVDFEDAVKRIPASNNRRFLLGIAGVPGAGKSTLAERLVTELNSRHEGCAVILPMDGYHFSNERLTEMNLLPLKGIPATFDAQAFIDKITAIKTEPQLTHYAPTFDRAIEASIENAIEISPTHQIIISEGNYLLLPESPWNQLQNLFDEIWYLDSDPDVIFKRLIARHEAGGKDLEAAKVKVESTDLPNAKLVERSRGRATIVIRQTSAL